MLPIEPRYSAEKGWMKGEIGIEFVNGLNWLSIGPVATVTEQSCQ
jgi:hypothetical protein